MCVAQTQLYRNVFFFFCSWVALVLQAEVESLQEIIAALKQQIKEKEAIGQKLSQVEAEVDSKMVSADGEKK